MLRSSAHQTPNPAWLASGTWGILIVPNELYKDHVTKVMKCSTRKGKSKALAELAHKVFGKAEFEDVKTGIGIVATKWVTERPMIFKGDASRAHGRIGTFHTRASS